MTMMMKLLRLPRDYLGSEEGTLPFDKFFETSVHLFEQQRMYLQPFYDIICAGQLTKGAKGFWPHPGADSDLIQCENLGGPK